MGGTVPIIEARRPGFRLDSASYGFLLFAAPGAGYAIAYAHQLGWAMEFGIPTDLIAPQLGNVLAGAADLLTFAAILASFTFGYRLIRPSVPVTPVESLLVGLLVLGAFLVLLRTFGDPSQSANTVVALALLFLAVVAAAILRSGVFWDRLPKEGPEVRALMNRVLSFWLLLGVAFVVSLMYGFGLGGFEARNQTDFLVSDTASPEVELAIYGDTVVLAPLGPSTHEVQPEFDIIKIGQASLHLRSMKVGPLKSPLRTP